MRESFCTRLSGVCPSSAAVNQSDQAQLRPARPIRPGRGERISSTPALACRENSAAGRGCLILAEPGPIPSCAPPVRSRPLSMPPSTKQAVG